MENYRSIWTSLFRTPHQLGYVNAAGVQTRYIEAGSPDRPPLLLLHGTAGSLENFCANIGPLADHFHVFAIDMLGCGFTDKPAHDYLIPDYADHAFAFLDAVGIGRARIIGVSLGSWVGARMVASLPERVEKLVMVAPAGIITDAEEEARVAEGVRKRRQLAAEAPSWKSVKGILTRMLHDPANLIDDLVAVRLAVYSQPAMLAAMPHLLAFAGSGGDLKRDEWRSLTRPILAVAAIDAGDMFMKNAYSIAELAPNAQLLELSGCDHWAQFERADAFNEAAIAFLA